MRPAIYPVTTLHLNHNQIICSTSKKQKEIILTGIPSIAPYTMPTTSELPKNTAHWTVNPERAILLIHDMQQYFVQPFKEKHRDQLIHNITTLCLRGRELGIPIAYTAQPGDMTPEQRGLLIDFWGPGMKVTPEDRNIVKELTPTPNDWISTKWRYSAFFRSDLLNRMQEAGRDQLIICGVYAHIGVLFTAVEAFTNDIQTFLVADAVADFSQKHHLQALEYAAQRCAMVCTTAELFT
ncbi:isochorismate hydrolase [Pseudomonas fragi]